MLRLNTLFKILMMAFFILGVASFCYAANLFTDPGFENGVNDWSYIGYPFTATTSPVHGGSYAATDTITSLITTQDFFGEVCQTIEPYTSGQLVYMEGWVKTNLSQGSTARGGIMVEFLNSSNTVLGTLKTEMGGVNDWFKIYVSGYAPANTAKVRAGAFIYAQEDDMAAVGGSVYADDLFIDKIAAPGGILTNPGFEFGLSGWNADQFALDATNKHSGNYSASDAINYVEYWSFISQEESPFTAGTPIYVSAWAKSTISQLAQAKGGLMVQFIRSNGTTISEIKSSEIGGQTDWRQLYVASSAAPSETVKIRIGAYIYAGPTDTAAIGGKFYVDDFVASTSPISPPPQTDLINADFENGVNDWNFLTYRPFVATNSIFHGGSYAAQHTIGNTNDVYDYLAFECQDIPFSAGQTAYASGWVKTVLSGITASGGIKIGFYNASGVLIPGSEMETSITGNTDWTQLFVYKVAPALTAKVRVSFFAWALKNQGTPVNKNVYVDDMTFSNTVPGGLILNGGFESGVSGWLTDTGYPMNSVTEEHYVGNASAKATIQQPGGTVDYWSRLYQEVAVTAGQTLYATLWTKTAIPALSMARAGLMVQFYDNQGINIGQFSDSEGGETNWSYEYVAALAPTGAVKARVGPFASASHDDAALGGNAYFDEVVASFSPLPPPTYPTVITNTGFEQGFLGWQDLYGPPSTLDTSNPHGGTYSAKKTIVDITDEDYFSIIYQDIYYNSSGAPFPSDRAVYLTGYVKSNINVASSAKGGIRLEYFDASDVAHELGKEELSAVNSWRQFYIAATIPAGAKRVRVSGFAFAPDGDNTSIGGTVNFDDFQYSYSYIAPPTRQTILQNINFENGLNYWQDLYGPPSTLDNVNPHAGSYSAKKTIVDIPEEDYFSTIYQDIYYNGAGSVFPANKDVYLTAFLKSNINPGANAKVGIKLEYFNAANEAVEIGKDEISAMNDWRQLYIKATIPAGAKKVRVSGFAWALEDDVLALGGTVNFDDFVYSYNIIPPPPAQTALLNVGFENGLNDWSNLYRPAYVIDDPVHSGNYAAKFVIEGLENDSYRGELLQEIKVSGGKRVVAKLWVRTDIDPLSPSGKAGLDLVFVDSNGGFLDVRTKSKGGQTDWTQLAIDVTAPANTAKVLFKCFASATYQDTPAEGGQAYFDDASLEIKSCLLKGTKITLSDGTLKSIEEIKAGDKVLGVNTDGAVVASAVSETFSHSQEPGFCIIQTEDNKMLKVTENHPVRNHIRYVEAGSLKVGDAITILDNKKLTQTKIARIIKDNSKVDVYNLEVEGTHNYFAEGCLVHNKKQIKATAMPQPGEPPEW